jgi:hypothetical protein
MSLVKRVAVFVIGSAALCAASIWLQSTEMPQQAASIAVESVNGGDVAAERARMLGPIQSAADDAAIVMICLLAGACFGPPVIRLVRRQRLSPLKGECRA